MTQTLQKFGIIGGGAWGTALAVSMLRAGRDATLWLRDIQTAAMINTHHENKTRLPGVPLDPHLKATTDLEDLVSCDVWLLATPAQMTRTLCQALAKFSSTKPQPLIITAKGLEQGTSALLTDVVSAELPLHPLAVLSGPSFAQEVALGLPTALTLATRNNALGEQLAHAMSSQALRHYVTDDVVGAQIGGAVKNVLAIASGIVVGRKMGENARAAIMTRGLAELIRLGVARGARAETMMGLTGLGDLILSCSSTQSRNMAFGIALGQGVPLKEVLARRTSVTEGVTSAAATLSLAQKLGVDMPIVTAVDAAINQGVSIDALIAGLLSRPLKAEAN